MPGDVVLLGLDLRAKELSRPIKFTVPEFKLEEEKYDLAKIYEEIVEEIVFDLHLDQKRPIYEGVTAHSGEYDGEVIEREAERVKNAIILATTKA